MTDLEAIARRTSRRTFTGPVPKEWAEGLDAAARQMAEEYGVRCWLAEDGVALFGGLRKSYGLFKNVQSLFVLCAPDGDEHGAEKLGWIGERLVLEATKLGLGTCWVAGTYDKAALAAQVGEGERLHAVIAAGQVPEPTGKEKFLAQVMHRKTKTVEQMSEVAGEAPGWFMEGMRAVVKAPSAVHAQPVVVSWRDAVVTARVEKKNQLIDLGIAKLHFELAAGGRFALGNGAAFQKS